MPVPTVDELMTYAVDGAGALTLVEYMKNYHNNNPGGGATQIAAPVLSMSFASTGDSVTVTNNTDYNLVSGGNVVLAYTIDGTVPSQNSAVFVSPKTMDINCVLTVRAFLVLSESNMIPSPATAVNIATLKCQKPVISYSDDTKLVTITSPTADSVVRYTTDGDEPTESSTLYQNPFSVSSTSTVKAKAFKTSVLASDVAETTVKVGSVFGVVWDYGQPSSALTRLTPETDPNNFVTMTVSTEPVPEIQGSQAGSSPFDTIEPWSGMKRRNFGDDGTGQTVPAAWDGDMGFSVLKDTMVYIPKFWVKQVDDPSNQLRYYYLSSSELEGFTLHPGSDQFYGCYMSYVTNDKAVSTSGSAKATATINNHRTYARNKGYGWQLGDFAELQALQWLYVIEYADWNSQSKIGQGGSMVNTTGGTDVLTHHTGQITGGRIRYRWIEDLWGNGQQYFDGLLTVGGSHNICLDRDNYNSTSSVGYELISTVNISSLANITKTLYDENRQWIIGFPSEASGGSSTTYLCDMVKVPSSRTNLYTVGDGTDPGIFHIENQAGNVYTRLSWKKAKASKPVFTITYTAGGTT